MAAAPAHSLPRSGPGSSSSRGSSARSGVGSRSRPGQAPYIELHCHSAYSFLDGASSPAELAETAGALGHPALALTDHDGLWGSMEFAQACKGARVRPITGAEVTLRRSGGGAQHGSGTRVGGGAQDGHVTLLVESRKGYANLCRLLSASHAGTRGRADRRSTPPRATLEQLAERAEGLICLTGCAREGLITACWADGEEGRGEQLARRLLEIFGPESLRVELQRPYWRDDRARNRWLEQLARRLGLRTVATGNVHAHGRGRTRLQDAFVAVRHGLSLEAAEPLRRGNSSSALARPEAMATRFADHPAAVGETLELAERLTFDLTADLGYSYPGSENEQADRELARVCRACLRQRYRRAGPHREAAARLDEELAVIRQLGLSGFFLLHRDLLELAREVALEVRGPETARAVLPPGRGRGSSVSSLVCYLIGLSHVDPIQAGLRPGRFLNPEVTEPPDIDLDFPRDVREALIPRVHERYGADHSALVAAFPTYRTRGAVRDFGKALGLPPAEVERVARTVHLHGGTEEVLKGIESSLGPGRGRSPRWRSLVSLCRQAYGLPRHPSQHSGGMVLATRPLVELCPLVPTAMPGRQIVQWDKDSCADAGFLKIDLLGLGMLSAVERCLEEVNRVRGRQVDLSRIPLDDPRTFASIQQADTTGTFQIESRAQMQMLVKTKPRDLEDLTAQVALVRPGPIQGGAVHPYIERRRRLNEDPEYEIPYEHPLLEPVLKETLGTIIYQDQVIEVAMALAGFSVGEGESLRRAMSRKRSRSALERHHHEFIAGALKRGVPAETAERVLTQIIGFSGFGFPKSHSAAFGLLAYQSAWLREHYGPEYLSALLNEQPMGFYPPDSLVHEAQRRGIRVCPPDINRSAVLCTAEDPAQVAGQSADPGPPADAGIRDTAATAGESRVRIGLGYISGLRRDSAREVVAEREARGPFAGLAELRSRLTLPHEDLVRIAWSGALASLPDAGSRRESLWKLAPLPEASGPSRGDQLSLQLPALDTPELAPQSAWEQMLAGYETLSVTIDQHPMRLLRPQLERNSVSSRDLWQLDDESRVSVAGLVIARQRPETANGVVFILLEDEHGTINLIVPPPVLERHRLTVQTAPLLLAEGKLERGQGTINVLASSMKPAADADLRARTPAIQSFGRRSR